ncbi:hypothetical protein NDI56_09925 [Haloarcula sp. S1CR25-12]|uniref:DUF8006 domain-containing protein n=1 Tax=Haloarcula saliterrae TaxID=2950534 RepID=A0ABU2FBR4_9EURY|nr:hypothetical protein [Haloarcula sp. S1CR25-12]MDS0259709.1 hypothetical protein [Haloarcula sp. S1CR25-12]
MLAPPLQVIDSFLLNYTIGDVLLLGFVLGAVGILPTRSLKMLGAHTVSIGVLLLLIPASMMEPNAGSLLTSAFAYKLVGLVLLALAPILYAVGRQ